MVTWPNGSTFGRFAGRMFLQVSMVIFSIDAEIKTMLEVAVKVHFSDGTRLESIVFQMLG